MNDLYFIMQRRKSDGFTLPIAEFATKEKAEKYIEAELKEKTIPDGYEEYIEHRQIRKNLQFEL